MEIGIWVLVFVTLISALVINAKLSEVLKEAKWIRQMLTHDGELKNVSSVEHIRHYVQQAADVVVGQQRDEQRAKELRDRQEKTL